MTCNPLEFLATFLPAEERVLTRTGVELHRLQYWVDALAPWSGQKQKVLTHYDPRDVSYVYVRTPAGYLVKAQVTTPGISAISLAEWSMRRQHERGLCKDPALIERSDASSRRCQVLVKEARTSRNVQRRKATEAAGDRFRDTPSPSTPVAPEVSQEIPVLSGALQPFDIEEPDYEF